MTKNPLRQLQKLYRMRFLQIAFLFSVTLCPALAVENLLPNGGFEDWERPKTGPYALRFENEEVPSGWMGGVPPDAIVDPLPLVAKDESVKHAGASSVSIELVEGASSSLGLRNPRSWHPLQIAVEPGKKHVVRGWFKGENLVASPRKKIFSVVVIVGESGDFHGGDNNNRYVTEFLGTEGSCDWTPFEFEFETSPMEVSLNFSFRFEGTGKVWLDDVELVCPE